MRSIALPIRTISKLRAFLSSGGRSFTSHDGIGFDKKHPRLGAIIVSESLVKRYFAHEDPISKFIYFDFDRQSDNPVTRYRVIGVVGDTVTDLDAKIAPTFYLPILDGDVNPVYLVLHTSVEPHSIVSPVRRTVHSLDPTLPLFHIRTTEELAGHSAADRQFSMLLFTAFAALALLLAAVGLYGVLSYAVSQRQSEIGIRLALGADVSQVRALILKQGMKPAIIGVAAGLLGAAFATQAMRTLLFDIEPSDPATFMLVSVLLLAVTLLACYIPSVRATRIDPANALRTE